MRLCDGGGALGLGEVAADQALPSQYRKRPSPPPGSGYHPGFAVTGRVYVDDGLSGLRQFSRPTRLSAQLTIDLQVLQCIAGRLHKLGRGVWYRGVIKTRPVPGGNDCDNDQLALGLQARNVKGQLRFH
jgi:hypothetical protein